MKIGKTQVFLGRNPQREQISSHDRKLDILIHNVVQNDIAPMFGDEKLLEEFLRKIHNFKAGKLQEEILFENFIKETEELVNKFIPYIPEKLPEELMNLEGTIERIVEVYLHSYANRELMIANTKRDLSSALQEGEDTFSSVPMAEKEKTLCLNVALLLGIRKIYKRENKHIIHFQEQLAEAG